MTSGDHIFDNAPNIYAALTSDTSILIRPANFYEPVGKSLPGKGYIIVKK
jgi:calcineurin-like phosphoesterase